MIERSKNAPPGKKSAELDSQLFIFFTIILGAFLWPALLIGWGIWMLVHRRGLWIWVIVGTVGVIAAGLFWLLDNPARQLQAMIDAFDINHPLVVLHIAIPWWEASTALAPIVAGAIALFRPTSAREKLLKQVAQAEARRVVVSQRATRAIKRAPDTISQGDGVLGRVIEE